MELTDQEIIDYLLGDIKEPEQLRVEESIFSGDDLFERLSVIEHKLIDLYVFDRLSDSERRAFEEKYLINNRRRAALASSRHFTELLHSYQSRQPTRRTERWSWLKSFFGSQNAALQFALTSLLLVVLAGFIWLLFDRAQLKNRSTAAEAALQEKEEELRKLRLNSERVAEERAALQREREKLSRDQEVVRRRDEELRESEQRSVSEMSGRIFATFVLTSTVRSGDAARELVIPRMAKGVRLVAYWESEPAGRYRASLKNADGEEVWSGQALKSRSTPNRIVVTLPAYVFNERDYFLKIEGLTKDGQPAGFKEYALSVRNQSTRN